ncbi:transposase-like protein [Azospirillum lipoferum]|nr:transposase-like protein [Azospirillum lipoferum]
MFIRIRGKQHYLWRVIDQNGVVLDILIQSRRNTKAAKRFFRKLLKGLRYAPRVVLTDKLKSYAAVKRSSRFTVLDSNPATKRAGRCSPTSKPTTIANAPIGYITPEQAELQSA